jgi:hypothetical protein
VGSTDADCDSSSNVCRITFIEYLDKGDENKQKNFSLTKGVEVTSLITHIPVVVDQTHCAPRVARQKESAI